MSTKKFVAISCSHGHMLNRGAADQLLAFCDEYKPDTRIHLGDALDMTAFRGGAAGTPDETAEIPRDLQAGLDFLGEYRPTHFLYGNHEDRLTKSCYDHRAIVAHAARAIVGELHGFLDSIDCQYISDYHIEKQCWFEFGGTKFMHGFFFNENAARDHAEHFGNCVFGHTHQVVSAAGRRADRPVGHNIGWMGDVKHETASYAKLRRATSRWRNALSFGSYTDTHCEVFIAQADSTGTIRIPR